MNRIVRRMSGIRLKAFLYVGIMFILFLAVVAFLCSTTFQGYVNLTRKADIKRAYRQINTLSISEYSENSSELRDLTYKYNLRMLIKDKELNTVFSNLFPMDRNKFSSRMDSMIKQNIESLKNDNYKFIKDPGHRMDFVTFVARLDSGYYLYISIPVTYVRENTRYMISFMLILGLVAVLISFYASYKIVGRFFVKPIVEISGVAEKITRMDFSEKCRYSSNDELGLLSTNINIMSAELEKNIENLKFEIENTKKVDEMRKNLIMNISHELKTPVFLIQSYAEGLRENIVADEKDKEYYCNVIVDETARMDTMIKEILELARLEVGNTKPNSELFLFSEIADSFIASNDITVKNKNINIVKDYEGAKLYADQQLARRVVNNLLINAFDYVNNDGKIVVRAKNTDGKCVISVYNTGSNIPDSDIDKIWYSFYKVDKTGNRSYGGTGIGLSIVKAVMDAHGGKYYAKNVEDGVEFGVEFPNE